MRLGAHPRGDGSAEIAVWAPNARTLAVDAADAVYQLERGVDGVFTGSFPSGEYLLELDEHDVLPDPCSRWQPYGVRGVSAVVEPFTWTDSAWGGVSLDDLVVYELHVGTFTDEGTFDAVIPRLAALRRLGVTAIELMPVATFPGERGWGYDGVYIYAPHPAYGGPAGLARLVDAAHAAGLGVILDVVYNHVGPGNDALTAFGPYFSAEHHTFWGAAIDYSEHWVREWAVQNAEQWIRDYHVDGLRLDAVQAIVDDSRTHICAELKQRVGSALVISETAIGDWRPIEEWGHDAQWSDAPHHELHVLLTGEQDGYYKGFGSVRALADDLLGSAHDPRRVVVFAQDHDQVGNRARGDRLPAAALRVAAAVTLFSPCTPLLFMGEECLTDRPFQFFTDHIDPAIADATRAGRKKEFEHFTSFSGEVPDPQSVETFLRSKLGACEPDPLYRELLALRRELPRELEVVEAGETRLHLRRGGTDLIADFGSQQVEIRR
jgi:maltooligosyltrehalose trehalohydrolase